MAERREMGRIHDVEAAKREHELMAERLALLDIPQRAASTPVQAEIRALKSRKLQLKDRIASLSRGLALTGRGRGGELGSGSFAKVLQAQCLGSGEEVAIKLADVAQHEALRNEYSALRALEGHARSFPRAHHFGIQAFSGQQVATMVMDRLGPSLENIVYRVTLGVGGLRDSSVLLLAQEMVTALHILSMNGIIHRDCQPGNWLFGLGDEGKRNLKLIDFGCSAMTPRSFIPHHHQQDKDRSGEDPSINRTVRGTLSFSSARLSRGENPDRYSDDLETVAYVLMWCLKGSLPWSHLDGECARLSCQGGWESDDATVLSFYHQSAIEKDLLVTQVGKKLKEVGSSGSEAWDLAVDLLLHSRTTDRPDYGSLLARIDHLRQRVTDQTLEWDQIEAF